MTKIEISPADIRKGDLIRYEYHNSLGRAEEWIASRNGQTYYTHRLGKHFLLDRPEQPFKVGTVVAAPYAGINLYVRGGTAWYAVPSSENGSRKAIISIQNDKDIRNNLKNGFLVILSEPA